LPRPGRPQY